MVDNVNSFKFGKLSGEFLKNLKTGLKETDLKTEKEIKLFKAIDADKNGVIDKSEIDKLYNALDTSNDGKISKKEAKAYLKENSLEDLKKKDLKNFLNKYVENTEDVANAEVVEGKVQITYKDGSQEIVNSDRSKELINKDAQGNTVKKEVTEDYKLKQETVTAQNGDTKATKYAEDGKTIQQTVEKEVNTNTTTTVNYENGKKSSKKVEKGTTEENYKYEDETEVLDSKIENKGIPAKEKHSKYTYNADKSVTETITEPAANRTTVRTKSETGVVEDITDESGKTHNVYNANNKKLSQTKMVNGKTYSIQYDGTGNTSVVVQNGESIDSLAKKFGCTKEEIINANKELLNGKKYFNVGDEVKIPKEIEADEKALQGRKSSEGAKAEFARDEQIRAQKRAEAKARAAAENKAYKELGLKNHTGAGKSITDEKGNKYTVVGQAGYNRTIAKDKKGNIHVISHDKKDLKTQYVKVDVANVKAGKKRVVINNRAYYTDGKVRDKHGRMTVTDWTGKASTLSGGKSKTDLSDRKILKDGYVEASDAIDAGHGKATYLENGIKYVQSSDGTYWYFDEKGQALNANQVEKQIAQKVTQDLDEAADGWGTDEELMSKANSGISSPGVLSKIEQHYQAKGYKADNEYKTAYEQFQGSELKRSEVYVNNAQLVKNNAIQDQSRRDEIIQTNILEYGKTKENLQSGLDAIGNRTDFDNANRAAAKYNQEHGNQAYFKNQSAINTLIYHQSEGDADSIHAANNKLIDPEENFLTSDEIIRTKAEEGVYYLQDAKEHTMAKGLADQARDAAIESNDAEVYAKMDELLNEKGEASLKDTVSHTRLAKVGYGNFSADERAEMALNELKSSLYSANAAKPDMYSAGSMTTGTAFSSAANQLSNAKNAEYTMDNLYKVLNSPESYAKFKKMVDQDPKLKTYLAQKGFDEKKLKFETKSSNLSNDEIRANKVQYENIKKALEQSKHEFQSITAKEGNYDSFINKFRDTYGLGITREGIAKLGENSSYMLHNLELAAEGKLTDAKGNPISFEDYAKELNITTEKMNETNTQYQQHQAYAKMAVDGIITVATIPVGGGAVKVLSSVVNGVKTFKVVRALDAAGKTVKEIGVVKNLAAAQKLAATTAKAAMSESKVGQAALKAGQHLTSTANIAKSTVTGATSGAVMYGKERLNTMTSAEGDSMEARSQAEKNFVSNAAAAGVGYHVGGAAAYLDELGAMGRVAGTAAEVTSDAGTSAMINKAQTGEAFVSAEDMVTSVIFNAAGHASFGKSHVEAPKAQAPQGVMHATGDAAHHSGGKLNAEKMENARTEVRDIAQNGTPKEVAKAHQAADYQQVQSRAQGRELKQNIEDASGFVSVGKERIALDSSSLDDLAKAKKAVEGWSNGTRDKEAILAKIDTRMNEIKAGQVKPTEPARASEIVDEINTNVNKASENIMEGKTGAIGSHDAATLRDNLVNNVKTEEDVEKFIADIKNRVGVDDKGNMHVYQVQGKDHAADLVNQAETKLKSIRANKADMQQITTILDDAISSNKGLSEDSLKSIRAFSAKSNSVEDLQNIIDKMKNNNIKKSSAQKKLIRDMQEKVDILKAKQSATNVVTAEPKKAQVADDGKTADFTTEQQRIYQEEMQAVKEAPAPAQKPQETAPQPVEVKPENNVQNNTNKINNNNEAVQKPAVEKAQNNAVENKPVQSTSEKPVSGQKMDSVKSTQTTKAHIKQVIKDLPDNMKQSFVSIYNEISNLTSMVNVAAIRNKISTKFSKYAEALNSLTDRLEAKISSLKNSLKTTSNTGSSSIKVVTTEKEANSVYQKMVNDRAVNWDDSKKSLSVMKDGKPYFIDVQGWRYEIHESSGTGNFITDYNKMNKQINTPWKMHIYANSPQEWANAAQVAMPYLQENKIMYKTMSEISEDEFNAIRNATNSEGFHSQTGKAFTVYFRSEDEFIQAAKDLETRFKQSGLKSSGTVANEHQVGDSGFLSYRHEGAERGTTYKPDNVEDPYLKMLNNEKTTTPKSNNHVVESEAENLFNDSINMNEKNVVSGQSVNKPAPSNQTNRTQNSNKVSQSVSQFNAGDKLPKGQEFAIKGNEVFRIGNSTIDLSSPEIKNRMKQMKDGQTLTIGRDGDIQIWADDTVSRKHLEITKTRDGFVVRDISSNGTFVSGTKSVNQTREVRFETSTYNRQGQVKASGVSYNNPRLNKYKINKNTSVKSHERFYQDNKELFAGTRTWKGTIWQGYTPADQHHGAWKMHMYSIDEHDWQQMSEALIPYLKDNGIEWKTFNAGSTGVHELNGSSQEGKAFTIYPRDNAHMEQIARDLDYIIKNNGLNINGSNIVGDRAMGDNGRLFYRYEYNTGAVKDINLDLSNRDDFAMYDSLYDGNDDRIKRNGKANYLADDMTPADDPWFNFNPSDPNSYPDISEYVENLFSA